ncbi:hypothetical protein GC197_06105 [bacterium]|nr:hypothetical protein [bacterium]
MSDSPSTDYFPMEEVKERTIQFNIVHIMAAMTGIAFLLALLAPAFRMLGSQHQWTFLFFFTVQLAILALTVLIFSFRRKLLIKAMGDRIGIGYPGSIPGKYGPIVLSTLSVVMISVAQLAFTLVFSLSPAALETLPFLIVQQVQLPIFAGAIGMNMFWGRTPGVTEFFEKGVLIGSFHKIPWGRVVLRPSKFSPDRIVMVYIVVDESTYFEAANRIPIKYTKTLQVLEPTRSYLLDRYGETPEADDSVTEEASA